MIFVPVIDHKISKTDFYCSICKSWLKITDSFRNIRRHIHKNNPDFEIENNDFNDIIEIEKEKIIAKNIILFILFRTQTFQYIEEQLFERIVV